MKKCQTRRINTILAAAVAVPCVILCSTAVAQTAPIASHDVAVTVDSGVIRNLGDEQEVIWSDVIVAPHAEWIRLEFDQIILGADLVDGVSSILRITSVEDGAFQLLDATSAGQWQNTSAYFNGDAVTLELIAYPNGLANRISIATAVAGDIPEPMGGVASTCGPTDDRELSSDDRAGRALPIGCTAWIINDANHCMLTAGHCAGSSLEVIEFNVPLSNSNGGLNHPGPEDQYVIDLSSKQSHSGGVGNDWGYFGCFPNSTTGLTAFETQGDYYTLAAPPAPEAGDGIRITGYGTVVAPVSKTWNQVQKTHVGPFSDLSGSALGYRADTSGGNSGSPVIFEETGLAIGIHTHGGCSFSWNSGTGVNNGGLQNALANPKGVCAESCLTLDADQLVAGSNATFTVTEGTAGATVSVVYGFSTGSFIFDGSTWCVSFGFDIPGNPNSRVVVSGVFDGAGTFTDSRLIPSGSSDVGILLQAAQAETCPDRCMSNILSQTIQ